MISSRLAPALLLVSSLLFVASVTAQSAPAQHPAARITQPIANYARATLAGSQPPRARLARDLGAVDPSTPLQSITLHFSRSPQQQADLEAVLAAQQDPSSPQFHQFLSPADFGARFGVADADIAKTEAWLQSQGFTVQSVSPSRNSITFSGTAATVATAFGAPLHRYSFNGETHIAPSADLQIPAALAGVVADIRNLSDFRPKPRVRPGNGAAFKPSFTSGQTGNHFLTPGDIAVIYDIKAAYNAGYNGAGQTIAVMGQSAVDTTDVTRFQAAIGQTANPPNPILVPGTGNSQIYTGDESESDLDLEYATGIAPGAQIEFVYVGSAAQSTVFDSLTWAIQNRIAPILNISYGECEAVLGQSTYSSLNALLAQAAAQGQTIVSAAGDSGSADCFDPKNIIKTNSLSVDFPSSSQYVTGVGGTEFSASAVASGNNQYFSSNGTSDVLVSALSYIPEQAWNDNNASTVTSTGLSAGGGGVSMFTVLPPWQVTGPGLPVAGVSNRLVPDIALDSSPNNASYAYCSSDNQGAWVSGQQGSCTSGLRDSVSQDLTVAGGTSFAAPIFAGMVAILSQAKGYTYQGVLNPTLYSLASNPSTYASAFHDITTGNNECNLGIAYCATDSASSYSAGVGYDEATGLGSVDLNNLLTAWPKNTATTSPKSFKLSATSATITQTSSTSSVSATSTVTVTPANGYTGTVQWTVAADSTVFTNLAQTQVACYSIANTTVSSGAATATLTITSGNNYSSTNSTASCPSGSKPLGLVRSGTNSAVASIGTENSGISTGAARGAERPAVRNTRSIALAGTTLAGTAVVALALLGFGRLRSRRRLPTLLALLLLAGTGLGLSGCGSGSATAPTGIKTGTGGGTGTPAPQTHTITVIGTDSTSSATTASTTFTLTLNLQ